MLEKSSSGLVLSKKHTSSDLVSQQIELFIYSIQSLFTTTKMLSLYLITVFESVDILQFKMTKL